jgi:hypothetical protein
MPHSSGPLQIGRVARLWLDADITMVTTYVNELWAIWCADKVAYNLNSLSDVADVGG